MNEDDVVDLLRRHYISLFPMRCSNCDREFESLASYIAVVKPIGKSISYDAEVGTWGKPGAPLIGSASMSNCPCGTTMSLTTETMETSKRLELLEWIKSTAEATGEPHSDILQRLRLRIREAAAPPANQGPASD